ncbi:hypothetical protein K474DRAFT_1665686 [Panus rudis PR-1116 ss-1]|nr:hypothetical protein K474DRAFT_1665686 [Panus rudis PR-1116 ss-1]
MSHFTSDNKNSSNASFVPPQEEKREVSTRASQFRDDHLVPPQEEKRDMPTTDKTLLEKGLDYVKDQSSKFSIVKEGTSDSVRDKTVSDSVRAGAAGVTGEDLGFQEKTRVLHPDLDLRDHPNHAGRSHIV